MRTNVIATLEEMRLRTKLVSHERNEATPFRPCSHTVDVAATGADADEDRQPVIMACTPGWNSTY